MHSERVAKAEDKFIIIDLRSRGLFVKVSRLKFEDTGKYWVGIDKIFADIMTSVNVIVTEGKSFVLNDLLIYHNISNISSSILSS